MPIYKNDRNVITPLFDQIRRITETEDAMTFERATEALLNITPGGGLPSAESATFGIEGETAYGIKSYTYKGTRNSGYTRGWRFYVKQAISILGLRFYEQNSGNYSHTLKLWNDNGEVVKQTYGTANQGEWADVYFNEPVNCAIGEYYVVSVYCASTSQAYADVSTVYTNSSKISINQGKWAKGDQFPTTATNDVPLVDIIIGSVATELPENYQIQRTTMDDIAEEVQRITGTESKMTTAQIVTALQGIATPTTE